MQCSKQMRYFLETEQVRILNIKETPPPDKNLTFWKHKHMTLLKGSWSFLQKEKGKNQHSIQP